MEWLIQDRTDGILQEGSTLYYAQYSQENKVEKKIPLPQETTTKEVALKILKEIIPTAEECVLPSLKRAVVLLSHSGNFTEELAPYHSLLEESEEPSEDDEDFGELVDDLDEDLKELNPNFGYHNWKK